MKYVILTARVVHTLWHGTSSVNLRSILVNGLVNQDENVKTYKKGTKAEALISGTYLSMDPGVAMHYAVQHATKYKSNPVLVACDISMGHDVMFDEDLVEEILWDNVKTSTVAEYLTHICLGIKRTYGIKIAILRRFFAKDVQARELLTKLFDVRDSFRKSKEDLVLFVKLLGRLSAHVKPKKDAEENFVISSPIKYKGNRKILAIWERISCDKQKPTRKPMPDGTVYTVSNCTEHWVTRYSGGNTISSSSSNLFINNLVKMYGGKREIPTLYLDDKLVNRQRKV